MGTMVLIVGMFGLVAVAVHYVMLRWNLFESLMENFTDTAENQYWEFVSGEKGRDDERHN